MASPYLADHGDSGRCEHGIMLPGEREQDLIILASMKHPLPMGGVAGSGECLQVGGNRQAAAFQIQAHAARLGQVAGI